MVFLKLWRPDEVCCIPPLIGFDCFRHHPGNKWKAAALCFYLLRWSLDVDLVWSGVDDYKKSGLGKKGGG